MNLKKNTLLLLSTILFLFLCVRIFSPNFFLFKKKPELIKGLLSEISVAKKEFNARVQKSFPPNTSDAEINGELSNQGFDIKSNQAKKVASYKAHNFACRLAWLITWQVDDEDNIYDLKAKYNTTCL